MIAVLSKSNTKQEKGISAWQITYLYFHVTVQQVIDNFELSINQEPSRGSIRSASGVVLRAKRNGTPEVQSSEEQDWSSKTAPYMF